MSFLNHLKLKLIVSSDLNYIYLFKNSFKYLLRYFKPPQHRHLDEVPVRQDRHWLPKDQPIYRHNNITFLMITFLCCCWVSRFRPVPVLCRDRYFVQASLSPKNCKNYCAGKKSDIPSSLSF